MISKSDPRGAGGKLLGVCAELAALGGIHPLVVRALGLFALLCAFKLTIVAYCAAAVTFRLQRP